MKAIALAALLLAGPAAAQPPSIAVFDFSLTNTSPAPSTAEELARLHRLDAQLRDALAGRFTVVDTAPVQTRLAGVDSIRGCNGCELELARQLGAQLVAYGWVQKVSNLILNVNLVIEDAQTGRPLHAQSVDIRGNTDESWQRGLRYLLNERMFPGGAMKLTRRALPLLAALGTCPAPAAAALRVGTLRFGSVAWELDVMRAHQLDTGFALEQVEFAAGQASQVALQAGRVDMVLQDWLFVSRQRAAGADWTFAPASAGLGAVMSAPSSPVGSVADLPGRRLGIAGSPLDKSWLLLRAFATKTLRIDLDAAVEKTFGPPPLLAQQLQAGRLDAVLTYWPFAARGEAEGLRAVLDMADVLAALEVPTGLPMLGYVFSESWAAQNRASLRRVPRRLSVG